MSKVFVTNLIETNNILKEALAEQQRTIATNEIDVSTPSGIVVYADSSPIPTLDTARGGWLWRKVQNGSEKLNYYCYNNQSNNPMILEQLLNFWSVVNIDNIIGTNTCPFLALHTMPTGVNDAGLFYHSRITWGIDLATNHLYNGEKIMIYRGLKPTIYPNLRKINLTKITIEGEALNDEVINLLSIHTDSSAPISTQLTVSNIGWSNSHVKMNLLLK
jgi:hypothetical protein